MKQARKVENKGEIQNKQNFFLRNMILIQEHVAPNTRRGSSRVGLSLDVPIFTGLFFLTNHLLG